jgi:hypothetical protein
LIAEEVKQVAPKLVVYERGQRVIGKNADGSDIIEYFNTDQPETVRYTSSYLITALLKAVQMQKTEIESLKNRVLTLESHQEDVNNLKTAINDLIARVETLEAAK